MTRPSPSATPDLSPLETWIPLPHRGVGRGRSFVSGDPDGERIRIRYFRDGDAGMMVAKVWFGPDAEGPPGHAHGGSQAAVLDEAMGGNAWLQGHPVLAGTLTIRYRRPLPLGTVVTVRTDIASVDGRKVVTSATLEDEDGVYCEGEGVFIVMKDALRERLFEEAQKEGRDEAAY